MDKSPSPFFLYSYPPSRDETPSPTDGPSSPTDEPPSPTDEPPSPTDEPPSPLLKSRIPRKTIIVDPSDFKLFPMYNLHCPLRKGIIYYDWKGAIFEHNIYSSGKHEPQIIVPKHPWRELIGFSFIPIKGNHCILLFAKYWKYCRGALPDHFLHLSIHKICSDSRVGPALWSFNRYVHCDFNTVDFELIKSTENPLAITFCALFDDHWKLFDISDSDNTLIESGGIDLDLSIKKLKWVGENYCLVKLSPDRHIFLGADPMCDRRHETIDIHYSDSGGTNFSFVTRMSIPIPIPEPRDFELQEPTLVFSADGSKFAIVTNPGRVSVWDIRSKVPLKTFIFPECDYVEYLQFSDGKLAKEVLVFVTHYYSPFLDTIHLIDATSFETEETFLLRTERNEHQRTSPGVDALFFDPSGGTLYAENNGTLYEWDLLKNKRGPE